MASPTDFMAVLGQLRHENTSSQPAWCGIRTLFYISQYWIFPFLNFGFGFCGN
jgi:hypothetical protein